VTRRVLITGLAGLVGTELAAMFGSFHPDWEFGCIVRGSPTRSVNTSVSALCGFDRIYRGSIEDLLFLVNVMDKLKPDLVIHLAQMRLTPCIVDALLQTNLCPKLIVLGTTGVFSKSSDLSRQYRFAEKDLASRYPPECFTVIRSNLIYGSLSDKNFHKLFTAVHRHRPVPLPSFGSSLYQPVYYKDLSKIIFSLSESDSSPTGFFNVSGPSIVSLSTVVSLISFFLNKEPIFVYVPSCILIATLKVVELTLAPFLKGRASLPLTSEQVYRLSEHKIYDNDINTLIPGFQMTPIEQGLLNQARQMSLLARC
jgi:dTDP-4-dehydrorhamnose reductase